MKPLMKYNLVCKVHNILFMNALFESFGPDDLKAI